MNNNLKPKNRQLTLVEKGKILAWRELETPMAFREIGRRLNKTVTCIRKFFKKYKATAKVERKKGTSPKRKTTRHQDQQILKLVMENRFKRKKKIPQYT